MLVPLFHINPQTAASPYPFMQCLLAIKQGDTFPSHI